MSYADSLKNVEKVNIDEALERVRRVIKEAPKLVAEAQDVAAALEVCKVFGVEATNLTTYSCRNIMSEFRNIESCMSMLPVIEYFESLGWQCTGSVDYPDVKNRDFILHRNGISLNLQAYFTSHNCKKIPVATQIVYRMECGLSTTNDGETHGEEIPSNEPGSSVTDTGSGDATSVAGNSADDDIIF